MVYAALAPLASLRVQDRYIVNGTKDEYLLPDELLERAISLLFEQRVVKVEESRKLEELKQALRACNLPGTMSNSELVFDYGPWKAVREKSRDYLAEIGFDLETWEKNELGGA